MNMKESILPKYSIMKFKKVNFLKKKIDINNFHFFFVPVDKNIECFDVFNLKPTKDLFYAMSHGVNRATLKEGTEDDRINFW